MTARAFVAGGACAMLVPVLSALPPSPLPWTSAPTPPGPPTLAIAWLPRKLPLRTVKELMEACKRYIRVAPRDFVTFEYVMLDGVNDSDDHARELVALVKGVSCKFNLIPFNPFPGSGFARSPAPRIAAFRNILMEAGLVTTTRKTRGDDIDGACGQLAGQVQDKTRRRERRALEASA